MVWYPFNFFFTGNRIMTAVTLYLASASPRRREILDQLGLAYQLLPQDIDESRLSGESPEDYVCRLARAKAQAALSSLPQAGQCACLGSDTTVVLADEIFEKPRDEADARRILQCLSGRTHEVLTAVALVTAQNSQVRLSRSQVSFRPLLDAEITQYWLTGEPADKAGSYGVQGLGAMFISEIKGSYSSIMGLPVQETVELLSLVGITAQVILQASVSGQKP